MLICNIPFNTITYAPEGHQSCCLHNMKVHKGLTDEEFWNCDEMRAMRKGFLDGNPVGQCGQCVKYHLALKGNDGLPPPGFYFGELDKLDALRVNYENYMGTERLNEVSEFEPIIAVLNVSNKCNLACRSCSPFLSDTQAAFRRKAGFEVEDKYCKKEIPEFMARVNEIHSIKEVLLVGGEPQLDPVFTEMLKQLRKNIAVRVQCNGTIYNPEFLDELLKFKEITLMFSIDGGKKINEYMRTNVKQGHFWRTVHLNIKHCLKRRPDCYFKITSTITNVSAFGLRELAEELIDNLGACVFDDRLFSFSFFTVTYPTYFQVNNLDKARRIQLAKKLMMDKRWLNNKIKETPNLINVLLKTIISACDGIGLLLKTFPHDPELFQEFLDFNARYDKVIGNNLNNIIDVRDLS